MIIHCDGSSNNNGVVAWGAVISDGDDSTEMHGLRKITKHKKLGAVHEIVAFIESVLYAHSHGTTPENVSFYTDDRQIVDGAQYHNVKCWSPTFRFSPGLTQLLIDVSAMYPAGTMIVVAAYLQRSHIVWVKGHTTTFMNLRADHLAKRTLRKHLKNAKSKIYDLEEWARTGFSEGKRTIHVPFLSSHILNQDRKKALKQKLSGTTERRGWHSLVSKLSDYILESVNPNFAMYN